MAVAAPWRSGILVVSTSLLLLITGSGWGAALGASPEVAPSPTPYVDPSAFPVPSGTDDLAANGFPATVLGLPVLTVPEASALIASGSANGRAIAVGGWWSEGFVVMSCPAPMRYYAPIEPYCGGLAALAPTAAQVDFLSRLPDGSSESFKPPADALQPRVVAETSGHGAVWRGVNGPEARQHPRRVVIIGHVADPRMWLCPPESRAGCDTRLVVDRFAWAEGRTPGVTPGNGLESPRLTSAQAREAVRAALPEGSVNLTVSAWPHDGAADLDPRIDPDSVGPFWFARAMTGPADAAGSAPLTEVVVSDATGATSTLDVAPAPDAIPATIVVSETDDSRRPTIAFLRADGSEAHRQVLQGRWTQPAVVPAGDYRIEVRSSLSHGSDAAHVMCASPLHAEPNTLISLAVSYVGSACELTDVPAPQPSPDTSPAAFLSPSASPASSLVARPASGH